MKDKNKKVETKEDLSGYPLYPPDDDIYRRKIEETEIDPENVKQKKTKNIKPDALNEKNFDEDMTAEDLDIPGNEDDESSMGDGGEDEENNNYSSADSD